MLQLLANKQDVQSLRQRQCSVLNFALLPLLRRLRSATKWNTQSIGTLFYLLIALSINLHADVIVEGKSERSLQTVNLQVRLVETTHAVADAFENRLRLAHGKEDLNDALGAVELLNGIAREGEGAGDLGVVHFKKIELNIKHHGIDGKTQKLRAISIDKFLKEVVTTVRHPDGLLVDATVTRLAGDRLANVLLDIHYGEKSYRTSAERSSTSAKLKSRLRSGWPSLLCRWDQFEHSRILIVKLETAPFSRPDLKPGVKSLAHLKIYRMADSKIAKKTKKSQNTLPPFRSTSKGDLMCQFTSENYNGSPLEFSDGCFVSESPRRVLGVFMFGKSYSTEIWYPWMVLNSAKSRSVPVHINEYDLVRSTPISSAGGLFPWVTGVVTFFEPIGKITTPPFSRGKQPKPDEIMRHSCQFDGAYFSLEQEFDLDAYRNSPPQFKMQLRSRVIK